MKEYEAPYLASEINEYLGFDYVIKAVCLEKENGQGFVLSVDRDHDVNITSVLGRVLIAHGKLATGVEGQWPPPRWWNK